MYLYHADIVRAIPNRQRHGTKPFFNQPDDLGFLKRRHSTADDAFALRGKSQQKVFMLRIFQCL